MGHQSEYARLFVRGLNICCMITILLFKNALLSYIHVSQAFLIDLKISPTCITKMLLNHLAKVKTALLHPLK